MIPGSRYLSAALLALGPFGLLPIGGSARSAVAQEVQQPRRDESEARRAARRLEILGVEDARSGVPADIRLLVDRARSGERDVQAAAVRALGRLERRSAIPDLLLILPGTADRVVQDETANALAQSLRGPALPDVPADQQVQPVLDALSRLKSDAAYRSVGRLPYTNADQFRIAEQFLRVGLGTSTAAPGAARGLEYLARISRKFLPLQDATLDRLRAIVTGSTQVNNATLRRYTVAALVAAQGLDAETTAVVLRDPDAEVRRFGLLALAGAGSSVDGDKRVSLIESALDDDNAMVRLEALRAWVRRAVRDRGCGRLVSALDDQDQNIGLFALDSLGDQCRDDQPITDRITAEARPPAPMGKWQREAHAFVALAKRAKDKAAISMNGFAMHQTWQVRMYAARAAAAMDDADTLVRLAADDDDNVREAALAPLRKQTGASSDAAFIAALRRSDYQLVRTAARELKGSTPSTALATALAEALTRITGEKKDTSRDIRLALIERLGELGSVANVAALNPLLHDFDPAVAAAAGDLATKWTGTAQTVDPRPLTHDTLPSTRELDEPVEAVVTMAGGRQFRMTFLTDQAPLTRTRFVRRARAKYYDGLTFHRIVPNAFIQGGSPGANEYAGDTLYMRDEVGLEMHTRGTVGISTRGRDTGDAQIFINLVDNPFLDFEYTVFARVCADSMPVVDAIQEGDRIARVQISPARICR